MFELLKCIVCEGDGFGPVIVGLIWIAMAIAGVIKKKKAGEDLNSKMDETTRRRVNERLRGKQPGGAPPPIRREEVPVKAPEQRSVPASGRNLPYAKRYQQKQTEKAQRRAEYQKQLEAKRILEQSRREQKVIRRDPVLPARQDPVSQRDRSEEVRVPVPQVKRPAVRGTTTDRTTVRDARPRPKRTAQVKPSKVAPEPARETVVEAEAASGNILTSLYEQDTLKRAIVYAEILGKPVGLREVI